MECQRYTGIVLEKGICSLVLDILVVVLVVILAGCGGDDNTTSSANTSPEDTTVNISSDPPPPSPPPLFTNSDSFNTDAIDLEKYSRHSVYQLAITQAESSSPCNVFISGDPVFDGFGVPWNATSEEKELLVKTACTSSTVNIEIGNGNKLQYIYNRGYIVENNAWVEYALKCDGPIVGDAWCTGGASTTLNNLNMERNNWIIAYVCNWITDEKLWKCGCADTSCATRYWQLQAFPGIFRYPVNYSRDNPNKWTTLKHGHGSLNLDLRDINSSTVDPFRPHGGTDFNKGGGCDDRGEQVYSIANGEVFADEPSLSGWGRVILIKHDAPTSTHFLTGTGLQEKTVYSLYGHLLNPDDPGYMRERQIIQTVGDKIKMGDKIGQVGDGSGIYKSACHLHFEIQINSSLDAGDPNYYARNPYTWNLEGRVDPLDLIRNNQLAGYTDTRKIIEGVEVVVHAYEDGLMNSFLLDYEVPIKGVDPANHNGSINPCNKDYTYGIFSNWRQGGCDNGGFDLGYNGGIFWKNADQDGMAIWLASLPEDGRYRVAIFVTVDTQYATGLAHYRLYSPEKYLDEFTIDQKSYELSFDNRSAVVPSPELVLRPDGKQHGAWVNVGVYDFTAGPYTQLELASSTPHQGTTGERVAADAVKFTYVGQ